MYCKNTNYFQTCKFYFNFHQIQPPKQSNPTIKNTYKYKSADFFTLLLCFIALIESFLLSWVNTTLLVLVSEIALFSLVLFTAFFLLRMICFLRTETNLHLHHLTYQYINTKNDTKNIMALCDVCHKKVHDISKKKQISVYKATIKFLGIKPIRTEKQTPKQKQIEPKSKLQEASEINNAKLLDRLKSYKKYFDINGKKKISTHKRNNY